ncbi:MAG: CoA-transferase [Dehalococcoidia bacterium]
MAQDKALSPGEAVSKIRSGDRVVIGGWGPFRKPMALVREIAASDLTDLTVMSFAALDLDMLIGAGKVKKAIYPFVALEGAPGALGNFRRAREQGMIDVMEISEYMFVCGFKASVERLPFYPTRSGLGTDILAENPEIQVFKSPYTGEDLVAVPAFDPDVALLHVNESDSSGNARIVGDPYWDYTMLRSAGKVIVSCERLVPTSELNKDPLSMVVRGHWVTGVVETPQGAHPGTCYPDYGWDGAHLSEYGTSTAQAESFRGYLEQYIFGKAHADYLKLVNK